jgi:SAM-dependent methyltransferase
MRNWEHHDSYINKLYGDVYPQPEDVGHRKLADKVINYWMSRMTTCQSVLDVGCGTGFCQDFFKRWNVQYEGICLGEDYIQATSLGRNVKMMDFNFLDYEDNSFDLIFSRHSLEHSPMPLLTLMEWARVSKNWLGLVLPAPEWYTYKGKNHYSVMNHEQIENLLDVAGWKVLWENVDQLRWEENLADSLRPHEYWYMCERKR